MRVAIIDEFKVVELKTIDTEAAYQELARAHQLVVDISDLDPEPLVGYEFDGTKIVFPENIKQARKISRYAFRERFTQTERIQIIAAARQNNTVGYAFQDYLDAASSVTYVDLNRVDLPGKMQALVAAGVLTAERADQIMNAPILEKEKYRGNE